ncbi:MAG: hypothetical protein COZ31_01605 [Nitrospirae bacterium CG_4_10_14_3_um_filter_44_29]|nr:MAG: hypothetical protein COW90_03035 [Nitrospirae bacterium CG22_combo_CG10-13_8_21_14_all_44_11]PIX89527.1 MAG: hypothetical protein COZ31_01605 [Nitrospirae bacterium CG_4_10_14_3_um_filter_44_29]
MKTIADSFKGNAEQVENFYLSMLCDTLVQGMIGEEIEFEYNGHSLQAWEMDCSTFVAISKDGEGLIEYFATDVGLPQDEAEKEALFKSYIDKAIKKTKK